LFYISYALEARTLFTATINGGGDRKDARTTIGTLLFKEISSSFAAHAPDIHRAQQYCSKHDMMCPTSSHHDCHALDGHGAEVIRFVASGSLCIPYSNRGNNEHLVHEATVTLVAFIQLRRILQEDFVLHENAPAFGTSDTFMCAEGGLADLFTVQSLLLGPPDFGLSFDRTRRITMLTHRRHILRASFDLTIDSMKRFERSVELAASAFWSAPQSMVVRWYRKRAEKQGNAEALVSFDAGDITPQEFFDSVLTGGEASRLSAQAKYCELKNLGDAVKDGGQNLHRFFPAATGSPLPTMTTKSMLFQNGRFLIPEEKLSVLGFASLPALAQYSCPPLFDFSILSDAALSKAAGNGMSIEVLLGATLWGLVSLGPLANVAVAVAVGSPRMDWEDDADIGSESSQ
jgi:hypothetical protein